MKNKTTTVVALVVIPLIGFGLFKLLGSADSVPNQTSSSTSVALSLNNWQTFSAQQNALKRNVLFSYPKEWTTDGADGGDSFATVFFIDTNKNSQAWKSTFLSTSTEGYFPGVSLVMRVAQKADAKSLYDSTAFYPSAETSKKAIIVDGKSGTVITREVTLPFGNKRIEYWAAFKSVDNESYEFGMRGDLYTNSEEVFNTLIQSINWGTKPVQ